jgi:RHS repeat-associated protein
VNVSNGLLTIQAGAGALAPKINFIEIGAAGSSTSAALNTAVAAAATQATKDTAKSKAKTPPTVKRNVWGSYVDELTSFTVKKPRKAAVRYYTHANSLFSVAAVTSSTGSVVERWSYNAYGVPTIKNSANATIAKSAVGNDRGFTGYKLDNESGLYFARTRMYLPKSGKFAERTPWFGFGSGYLTAYSLDVVNDHWRGRLQAYLGRGISNYRDNRYSLYDFRNGDPANRLEPFSEAPDNSLPLPPVVDPHTVVDNALGQVGNTDYGREGNLDDDYTKGKWKCNKFVYDMLVKSGAPVPLIGGWMGGNPPAANQWGDKNCHIKDYPVVWPIPATPSIGDIISDGHHVGIVSGPGTTVSAARPGVVNNDWGFRPDQAGKLVIRRYTCYQCSCEDKKKDSSGGGPSP